MFALWVKGNKLIFSKVILFNEYSLSMLSSSFQVTKMANIANVNSQPSVFNEVPTFHVNVDVNANKKEQPDSMKKLHDAIEATEALTRENVLEEEELGLSDLQDASSEDAETEKQCTSPKQASTLKKNENVMLKGRPCKIVERSISKACKHGGAKIHFAGLDLFTGEKIEEIVRSLSDMAVPNMTRQPYMVVDVEGDTVTVGDWDDGISKTRVFKLPDFKIKVLKACSQKGDIFEKIIAVYPITR